MNELEKSKEKESESKTEIERVREIDIDRKRERERDVWDYLEWLKNLNNEHPRMEMNCLKVSYLFIGSLR